MSIFILSHTCHIHAFTYMYIVYYSRTVYLTINTHCALNMLNRHSYPSMDHDGLLCVLMYSDYLFCLTGTSILAAYICMIVGANIKGICPMFMHTYLYF